MDEVEQLLNNGEGDRSNKKKCLKYVLIPILGILIIGLVIFLVYFFILKGDKEEIEKELCQYGYYLVSGISEPYSFVATYHKVYADEEIKLIDGFYHRYIEKIYMNNLELEKTFNFNYNFSIGKHKIYFYMNISSLKSIDLMFYRANKMITIDFTTNFNTENITSMNSLFIECNFLTSVNLSSFNTSSVTSMAKMFQHCVYLPFIDLSNFDTSSVTDMTDLFGACLSLTSIELSNFNTSSVLTIANIFSSCFSLKEINLPYFDTSSVTNMDNMFFNNMFLTSIIVSNFNTANTLSMKEMFFACESLTSIDVSNFDTSKVTMMSRMFSNCSSLTSVDLSNFNFEKLNDFSELFRNSIKLSYIDISSFPESLSLKFDNDVFRNISKTGTIIISKNIATKIEEIFEDLNMSWTITLK